MQYANQYARIVKLTSNIVLLFAINGTTIPENLVQEVSLLFNRPARFSFLLSNAIKPQLRCLGNISGNYVLLRGG